jgi:hypothetical protein
MLPDHIARPLIERGLREGTYPQRLYKYRRFDAYTEDIFRNHSLWFSGPLAFNDPFDCQIRDAGNYTRNDIHTYCNTRGVPAQQAAQIADLFQQNPDNLLQLLEEAKNEAITTKGVLAMSQVRDNILMWSHYADSHTGFVLGFTLPEDISFFITPFHAIYVDAYPTFQYLRDDDLIVTNGILSKSRLWEYEQEIRILKRTQGSHAFAPTALTEVILGARISTQNRDRLLQHLRQYGFQHVSVLQATAHNSRYELELNPIPFP